MGGRWGRITYSARLFSTTGINLEFARANATSSSRYVALFFSALSDEIPNASANRAFLFATAHSLVHVRVLPPSPPAGFESLRPH